MLSNCGVILIYGSIKTTQSQYADHSNWNSSLNFPEAKLQK